MDDFYIYTNCLSNSLSFVINNIKQQKIRPKEVYETESVKQHICAISLGDSSEKVGRPIYYST